ncbi:hypothetical protein [Moorena sp. SIO3H5]|uniref:hypothetical protein n=1 Tax=Moorena sp. SIO3H5 TaxID=2607834 RepID=UPI0013B807FC|nr:hypothetical protein [Moorena sp. SIO3H5]NEO69502.1 hypothetical protein [Moorena sp. SIO3H5]
MGSVGIFELILGFLRSRMNRSRVGILPAGKLDIVTGKMPIPPRCPFHLTLKIILLLSNAPCSLLPVPYDIDLWAVF